MTPKRYIKTDEAYPKDFDSLIKNGSQKSYFKIEDGKVTYLTQSFSDNFDDPEEKVRVGLFYDLIEKYGYKNNKEIIDLEFKRTIGHPYKINKSLLDIILYRPDKTPFAIFELKSESDYEKYFEDSIKTQLFERAANEDKGSGILNYLIYYTRYYDDSELIEKTQVIDYTKFKTWEQWEEAGRPNLRVIPKNYGIVDKPPKFIKGSLNPENQLRDNVKKEELDRIADDLHNVLWGGGQHQNELFYNLIGLFLTKIMDEKIKANGEPYDFQIFFEGDTSEPAEKTYERINRLYRGELDNKTKKYTQCALNYLLGYSDEKLKKTPDIVFDANKVKYVVETIQSISFTANKYDVLGDFFEKIVRSELKQTKGQYLTHHNIVDFIVKALKIDELAFDLINGKDGRPRLPFVIDPACGSGTFLIQTMKEITNHILADKGKYTILRQTDDVEEFLEVNFPERKRNVWAKEFIYGIEINPDLAMASKVNMVGHGDGSANIHPADGLIKFSKYDNAKLLNIESKNEVYEKLVNEQFDIVISNPPFSVTVDRETAKQFPELYLQGKKIANSLKKEAKKEVDTENLFTERWYQLLRPNGRLGVVLPESVFDTTSNREIRLFIFKYFWVRAVISLPHLAFAPYTMTKTSLLFAQKKSEREVEQWVEKWDKYKKEFELTKKEFDKLKKRKTTEEIKPEFIKLLKKYILNLYDSNDDSLPILELKEKYEDDIKQIDTDWWVFNRVSKELNYTIFMAHAEEIGYKRGANKEEIRSNELFDSKVIDGNRTIIIDNKNPNYILDYFIQKVEWK
ncbi:MAG: restriction endonuclease subunit M [Calditrichaceae bacterium]